MTAILVALAVSVAAAAALGYGVARWLVVLAAPVLPLVAFLVLVESGAVGSDEDFAVLLLPFLGVPAAFAACVAGVAVGRRRRR